MQLNAYMQMTQELISDIKQEVVSPGILKVFINNARRQLAGEAECLRNIGTISTVIGQRNYNFSGIVFTASGVQGPLHVRSVLYGVGTGQQWVTPRNWEWFQLYYMNTPVPDSGPPTTWAQYAQGAAGSFYLDPIPDLVYALSLDCACYPIDLVDETTFEAIPILWTDAIPYFAAYLAYLYTQNQDSAKGMFSLYEGFVARARKAANPSVNRYLYSQERDPTMIAKLGLQQKNNAVGG